MKKLIKVFATALGLFLVWLAYDYISWKPLPDFGNLPIETGILNPQYQKQIFVAQNHLKTIPEKLLVPSFSVAVGIEGEIIWSEAIGYQDIASNVPASTNTVYKIGSSSKAVTSVLAAKLVDDGLLNLDDSIGSLIKNYPKKRWEFTPRQLLSHTAGITDYEDLKLHGLFTTLCNCRNYNNVTDALNVFNDVPLLFRPNSDFKYTSFDIILLSAYIEEITGNGFLEVLQERITEPLDMNHTFGDNSPYENQSTAIFYETQNHKFRQWRTSGISSHDVDLSYKWAGGGLLSTPSDLVILGNAILNDTTFISSHTKSSFFTPQRLENGEINPQQYALGWRSYYKYEDDAFDSAVWMVHHGGVSKGSMNFLVLFPDYNIAIDASMNARAENFGLFWNEVMKLASIFLNERIKQDRLALRDLGSPSIFSKCSTNSPM